MPTIYELSVYDDGIDNYVLSSDSESSVEEFIDTYISIVYDLFDSCDLTEKAIQITDKMRDRDYEIDLDCDGETQYVIVTIRL